MIGGCQCQACRLDYDRLCRIGGDESPYSKNYETNCPPPEGPAIQVLEWFGMRGRGGFHFEVKRKLVFMNADQFSGILACSPGYPDDLKKERHPWISQNDKIPEIIEPGIYIAGFARDPWDIEDRGEFYFELDHSR